MAKTARAEVDGQAGSREADRRRTILKAAVEVFAKKGYHGCRIADVAREAKVAYGLVYHYFKNKDELLNSVFESAWAGFSERVQKVAESPLSLEEKIRGIAKVAFEAYRLDPRAVKVLILEIGRSPAGTRVHRDSAFAEMIRLNQKMFEAAQAKGELRASLDPKLSAALFFGAVEMGLTAFVAGFLDASDEAAVEAAQNQIAETFLKGVLAKEGAGKETAGQEWKRDKSTTRPKVLRPS